jgi:hypothetical protein
MALPWLQASLAQASAQEALPALDALRWLAGRGRIAGGDSRAWRDWLLAEPGAPDTRPLQRWPAGPALAALAGFTAEAGHGSWCVAQPVHLAVGLDHLRLAPLAQAALDEQAAGELSATVQAHFGTDAFSLVGLVAGAWLLRFNAPLACTTWPPDAVVGHNVHDFLPSGPAGAYVRSLMNEIQMLLHEHPLNQHRERTRLLPVNAWWLWGFGKTPQDASVVQCAHWDLHSDDPWLRGLWHTQGIAARDVAQVLTTAPRRDSLIALSQPPASPDGESLVAVDAGLLSWACTQLRAGAVERLELLLGEAVVRVEGAARFQFWRRPARLADLLP